MQYLHRRTASVAIFVLWVAAADGTALRAADATAVVPSTHSSETIQLFNGRDLKGWEGHSKYWSVHDGAIVGRNTDPLQVSTYLVTKRQFGDFRLLATVKLVRSETHSGIAFWGQLAPERGDLYTYAGHLAIFPAPWGLYELYGRNGLGINPEAAKRVGKQHGWNKLEILARDQRVRLVVNGTEVLDWRDPEPRRIEQGPIALQLHSNNETQVVHFKDLVLTTFPDDKLETLDK